MRAAARGRPLPDFLIIGAQRSGTSSLYQALVTHPRIRAARVKEVHFFDVNFEKGVDWYRTHFPRLDADRGGSGRPITGEASPYYLPHVHAPKRVAAVLGDVRLIVLLRNPVERAYSHYHSVRARCQEPLAFEEAIAAEDERTGRELERMDRDEGYRSIEYRRYSYLGRGHYAEQLERWFVHHPRERFVILASEDYYGHPASTYARVLEALGLPPHDLGPHPWINRGTYPPLTPPTRRRLEEYFRPHNERLRALLGTEFCWMR